MEAIEALARVNVLCLDKTGTITTGALEVVELIPFAEDIPRMTAVMNEIAFAFDDVNATQDALLAYFDKTQQWQIKACLLYTSNGSFCTGECEKGVCVKIDEELFSVSPETVDKFFEEEVLRRVH